MGSIKKWSKKTGPAAKWAKKTGPAAKYARKGGMKAMGKKANSPYANTLISRATVGMAKKGLKTFPKYKRVF